MKFYDFWAKKDEWSRGKDENVIKRYGPTLDSLKIKVDIEKFLGRGVIL
ncbi:MAG: hypothetical protein H7Y18_09165 [Clostridiaceae bacterium]|nr:hypothetical protein [Clostridiaceae bacterium]